ncbi:hypothetical protein RA955_12385 [Geobacillus proteiniphilus]|uniref:Oligopeptide ABC transporter, periplasmic oligopeptide-binding protein OppA n=1 Tax=Geobacillus proteiniphilus TaxID=860353 RepID=A0ABY9MC06_9BACL|nr:hypothetical protein [Geobacillus proteiniphilus]WMJ15572.1 hypothetical protein RA955_12385 [Geobacillus proteiniphilus]
MLKKAFAALTATALAVGMLAGCTDSQSSSSNGSGDSKEKNGIVTITTVRTLKDDTKFREGEDLNSNYSART